jgi:rubrerythrin
MTETKKTSAEWWAEVKADPEKLLDWLHKQQIGEVMAAVRMQEFADTYGKQAKDPKWVKTVEEIARQEEEHGQWIAKLIRTRTSGVLHDILPSYRYWEKTLPGIESWASGCAVAAHAEAMRLERIRVIAGDPDAPEDIRDVFAKILPQEEFHEKAFRAFASDEALTKALENHQAGMNALGLIA